MLAVLEQGVVDAALLSVPENIIAVNKGYNELIFLGDVVNFPQNGFGPSVTRIQQQPDEVYRMVRATLRGLQFITDEANREPARDVMMKQWRVSDQKLAAEMLGYLKRDTAGFADLYQSFLPEPATASLLALGVAMLYRRR